MNSTPIIIGMSLIGIAAVVLFLVCHFAWSKRREIRDYQAEQFGKDTQ